MNCIKKNNKVIIAKVLLLGALSSFYCGTSLFSISESVTSSAPAIINVDHIQSKIQQYKKRARIAKIVKHGVASMTVFAGGAALYWMWSNSRNSSLGSFSPTQPLSANSSNNQSATSSLQSEKIISEPHVQDHSDVAVLREQPRLWWLNGWPVFLNPSTGLGKMCLIIFGISALQSGSQIAAHNVWSWISGLIHKGHSLSTIFTLFPLYDFRRYGDEILTVLDSVQILYKGLSSTPLISVDKTYFQRRLIRFSELLAESIENFIAAAAYHALMSNDIVSYNWLLDKNSGLIISANKLFETLHNLCFTTQTSKSSSFPELVAFFETFKRVVETVEGA